MSVGKKPFAADPRAALGQCGSVPWPFPLLFVRASGVEEAVGGGGVACHSLFVLIVLFLCPRMAICVIWSVQYVCKSLVGEWFIWFICRASCKAEV